MFCSEFSKMFSPWSLGQDRTLGRALSMAHVEKTVREKWPQGVFGTDAVAEHLGKEVTGLEVQLSDIWGPLLLSEVWRGRITLVRERQAPRALELASRYLRMQVQSLPHLGRCPSEVTRLCHRICEDGRIQTLLTLSIHMKRAIELSLPPRCRTKMRRDPRLVPKVSDRYSRFLVPGVPLEFRFTADVVLVRFRDTWYASSHDHLLCYAGKVDTLASYALLLPWAGETYLSKRDEEGLDELIGHLQSFHAQTDQRFFQCAKLLDGLCQAMFLMTNEVDGRENTLMLDQIERECAGDDTLLRFFEETRGILRPLSAPALIEASSFGKCSGHPTVDVKAGLAQLRERTCNDRQVSIEWVDRSVRALKEHYVVQHILRERRWPDLLPGSTQPVLDLVTNDALPDGVQAARLNVSLSDADWDSISFSATRRLQPLTSLIPYIRDKTISLGRDDTLATYPIDFVPVPAPDLEGLSPRETYERTALVLYVLLTRGLAESFREFLDKLIRSSPADLTDLMAYLVIKVVPKEGELKTLARLFGEKTFNYRLHGILQEITATGFMQDTFPRDQAMACGELELKRRLHALTTLPPLSPDHDYVHLVTDISGWNNGFRHETVGPIGEVLDEIYGTKVFAKTHRLYENTLIVNKGPEGLTGWQGQLGGIEGLNQDTWVVVYLAQMHAIFSRLPYKYYFMDMGDNFIVKLAVPRAKLREAGGAAHFAMNLSKELAINIRHYGHDVKPDESTCSHHAFIFCHKYVVRGVQIVAHFRKAAKISGISDAFFPLLDNYIGCAFSNAHATVEQGYLALGPYMIAATWSFMYLLSSRWPVQQTRRSNRYQDLPDDELLALMLTPNVLGGFPILYLETMFLRSEADHLPQALRLQRSLSAVEPAVAAKLGVIIRQPREPEASLLTLLADPRSLALTKPVGPAGVLLRELDGRLSRTAKNEELATLYEQYDEEAQEALVQALQHNTVWPARLLGAVYGSSGFASRAAVVACFESSRTAIAFLLNTKPYRVTTPVLCRRALAAEHSLNRWRVTLVGGEVGVGLPTVPTCPADGASHVRQYHWRKEVTTITTPPMGHLFRLVKGETMAPGSTYITLKVSRPTERVGTISDHHCRGQFEPFLGHSTSSATRSQLQVVRSKDQMVDGVLNLALASSWAQLVDGDGSLRQLIAYLAEAYTDLSVAELQLISGERDHGSMEHHMRGRGFNPSISPNSLASILSLLTHDSRFAAAFQMGKKYTVNFWEEILFAEYMLLIDLQWGRRIKTLDQTWLLVLDPCVCFVPIQPKCITARLGPRSRQLAGSILPREARQAITEQLREAAREVGERGAVSSERIAPEAAATSLLMIYWASLTNCLETLSLKESTDAVEWRHLAYIQGLRLPKEISLNIIRRIPPLRLVALLKMMNSAATIWEQRRSRQACPGGPSVHAPGATALLHICKVISEGVLMAGLGPHLPPGQPSFTANSPPLYQMIWPETIRANDPDVPRTLLLPSDQDFHTFRRSLLLLATPDMQPGFSFIPPDLDGLRTIYTDLTAKGGYYARSREWLRYLGVQLQSEGAVLWIRRHHPTAMQDTARQGRTHYRPTPPRIPPGTVPAVAGLDGFDAALRLAHSLRDQAEEPGSLDLRDPPRECREVWHSTTRSPSRFICAACQIGLELSNGMKVAALGDGLGGITHLLAQMDRDLTVFYSTLYVGPAGEQAPYSIVGPRAQVLMDYMERNMRDVTDDIWAPSFLNTPQLTPDVLISDAELPEERMHVQAADALGKYLLVRREGLLMLRILGAGPATLLDAAAVLLQYCDQVTYAPTSLSDHDGYLIGRYGRHARGPRRYATFQTKQALQDGCKSLNMPRVNSSVAWCLKHGADVFPSLTAIRTLGVTARHLTNHPAARELVSRELSRALDGAGAKDLGGLASMVPTLVALDEHHPGFPRVSELLPQRAEELYERGRLLRPTLMTLSAVGLIKPDSDTAAADEDLDGPDI